MEQSSALKLQAVSSPIVVCGWESQLHEIEISYGEGD
jgi:hypothetical protein